MKKLALVLMFTLLATTALAQGWSQNNVGVYFDAGATSNYVDGILPGTIVRCYVVGTGLTAAATSGFEFKLTTEGDGSFISTSIAYPTQAANLANRPDEYVVGFAGPVPVVDGQFVFMEYDLLVTGPLLPVCTYLEPIYFASIPGSSAYLGEEPGILLPLFNSTGDPTNPNGRYAVCSVNGLCEGAVPSDDASWGSVKSLYR
jgi:hypothetical protein